jgi:hypothetical protein
MRIMLAPATPAAKDRALARLRAVVESAREPACPACGSRGPHEDNGAPQRDLVFLCACGEQFDAEPV